MLKIEPYFCTEPDAKEVVEWERRDALIKNGEEIVFSQRDIEVPTTWSDTALNIAASKYLYKGDFGPETSIWQLITRVCETIANWGLLDGYFESEDAGTFCNELVTLMVKQMACFNSPVLFNVGLDRYGVGSAANWRWGCCSNKAVPCEDTHKYPQVSACFIQGVEDNMESIMELAKTQAMLFKFGSGTGTNYSTLRSRHESLSGGGNPSGPLSFMRISDSVGEVVSSGGTTRRAAAMRILNINHPDILEFINCKEAVENLARDLIAKGHDPASVYTLLPFQNANHTVRISDEFMRVLEEKDLWDTQHVTNPKLSVPSIMAEEIWDLIATRAHQSGDPGIQFDDTINSWNPVCERQFSSNPCSEFMFIDDSACNLASVNLRKFQKEDGKLDVAAFKATCRLMLIAQDIMVGRASYPTERICENSNKYRPLGLGYTNFGAFLMAAGIPYDSDAGRQICSEITSTLHSTALATSAEMAQHLGTFSEFEEELGPLNVVLEKHEEASSQLCPAYKARFRLALGEVKKHGLRNAQLTVLAPTGTISFLMDCDTTGIEPEMALVKTKTLVGGGTIKQVNKSVEAGLASLEYTETGIKKAVKFLLEGRGGELIHPDHHLVFQTALGANALPWQAHIKMMAAAQPFLSGAISKTINMPKDSTVEDVKAAFKMAYDMGLKSVTVYRDGSKGMQPVVVGSEEPKVDEIKIQRLRLPDTRESVTHRFTIDTHKGYFTVGLYGDGKPGELFVTMAKEGSTISGLLDSWGIMCSLGLQYGIPLPVIVEKFKHARFEPLGFTKNPDIRMAKSIVDYIARWMEQRFLGTDTLEEELAVWEAASDEISLDSPLCDTCGSLTILVGSCHVCSNCGTTGGCS